MVWLLAPAGGGGIGELGWFVVFPPFVCVVCMCRLSGFIRSTVPYPMSISPPKTTCGIQLESQILQRCGRTNGRTVRQCQWTSIELVMLSTFTFTVIAIIIHFGSPVDTWHTFQATDEDGKVKKKCIQPWASSILFTIASSVPLALPEISMTHEYITLILLLARNATWNWSSWLCSFACVYFVPILHGFLLFFTSTATAAAVVIAVVVIATVSNPRQFPHHFHHLQFLHSWILLPNVCSLSLLRFILFFVLLLLPSLV